MHKPKHDANTTEMMVTAFPSNLFCFIFSHVGKK